MKPHYDTDVTGPFNIDGAYEYIKKAKLPHWTTHVIVGEDDEYYVRWAVTTTTTLRELNDD